MTAKTASLLTIARWVNQDPTYAGPDPDGLDPDCPYVVTLHLLERTGWTAEIRTCDPECTPWQVRVPSYKEWANLPDADTYKRLLDRILTAVRAADETKGETA